MIEELTNQTVKVNKTCASCAKVVVGTRIPFSVFMDNDQIYRHLGQYCPCCMALSCVACKEAAVRFSMFTGYAHASCSSCDTDLSKTLEFIVADKEPVSQIRIPDYLSETDFSSDLLEEAQYAGEVPDKIELKGMDMLYILRSFDEVRGAAIQGVISLGDELRILWTKEGRPVRSKWRPLSTLLRYNSGLKLAYHPVRCYTIKGLFWGTVAGIGLKVADVTVGFFLVNPMKAFLWVIFVASTIVLRWFPWTFPIFIFCSFKIGGSFFTNTLITALIGFLGGAPFGMAIGTAIGFYKRKFLARAADATLDGQNVILWGMIIPLMFGISFLLFFFLWWVPAFVEWQGS